MKAVSIAGMALAFAVVVTGCAAFDREVERRTPEASVETARIAGLDFDAARLLVDVRVDNPNPVKINVAGLDYELRLDGERALAGDSGERTEIPARGSGTLAVPITLTYAELQDQFAGLRGRDSVDYAIDFGVTVDVPLLGERRVPASVSGTMPIPQRPGITLRDLRVDHLGFDGARVVVDVEVSNPNTFDLALDALRYDLRVDGRDWASGFLARSTRIGPDERATLSIPLELDFAAMSAGVRQMLLGGGRVEYDLSGVLSGAAGEALLGQFELPFDDAGAVGLGH